MNDYPEEWKTGVIQQTIKQHANHCCEHCGMAFHPDSNLALSAVNRKGKPYIGTVHHINMNHADCRWQNLVFLCQRCHLLLHGWDNWTPDKPLPSAWHGIVPNWLVVRGYELIVCQLSLFEAQP